MPTHIERFRSALTDAYRDLFADDPEYAYSASRTTPEELARKMTAALIDNSASHEGTGIRRACKAVHIPHTRKAIRAYLLEEPV